jgi:hypothetical protein
MIRTGLWLMVDIVLGVVVAGVISPWAIGLVPEHYRGTPALCGLALVSIVIVAFGRRALGIGTSGSTG